MTGSLNHYPAGEPASLDLSMLRQLAALSHLRSLDPVGQILRVFFEHTPRRLAELTRAMEMADVDGVEVASHALRGGCSQVGARYMAHLAAFIEDEARQGIATNQHLAGVLQREFEMVRATLLREFTERKADVRE